MLRITRMSLAVFTLSTAFLANEARTNVLVNGSFESPPFAANSVGNPGTMPGWATTDFQFEVWGTGFNGVPSFDGTQHIELNSFIASTVSQNVPGIAPGSKLGFGFAHRGRAGLDTMTFALTDLGSDNVLGGGNDTLLFSKNYVDGIGVWAFYDQTTEAPIFALGNTIRFSATATASAGGNAVGNFFDGASLTVIPEPAIGAALITALGLMARRRAKAS